MNCLDYRRGLLAEGRESESLRLHRIGCEACADLHREQAAFEGELHRAFDVPVPEGFADRLDGLAARPAPAAANRRRFLAAASAAAVAAGLGFYLWRGRDDPMALACIDFVMKDEAKSIMMGAMPRADAARVLADSLPVERLDRIGKVMHIGPCPFQGGTAYHVVLMVPQDKVTLLIMPDTFMPAGTHATHDGMYASVVPLRKGSVGIVGSSAAVVGSVAGALRA